MCRRHFVLHEENQTFHLQNEQISYVFRVLPSGCLGQLYFGKRIHDRADFDHLLEGCLRSHSAYLDGDEGISYEHVKQEYPVYGSGDFRQGAVEVLQEDGSRLTHFAYMGYALEERMEQGRLPGHYVRTALGFIRNNYHSGIGVADVADYVGINRSYLYSLFVKEVGVGPSEYLTAFRMSKAMEMLGIPRYTVENVAYSCGYADPLVFSRAFKHRYGMTPLQFRSREDGEQEKIREMLLVR